MFNDYSYSQDSYPTEPAPSEPPVQNLSGRANIKVMGIGGAGNNAVNRMISAGINCAEFYVVNTDAQALASSNCANKIQIGVKLTKGLGAGADPDIGKAAAEENKDELTKAIEGTDLLFITAGMGGGTGTGAAPVIAKIARDMKILTVAVVTEPFDFEGRRRRDNTVKGLDNLKKYVDTLVIIPNDKIRTVVDKNTPFSEALRVADDILKQGIRSIAELIVNPSLINLDFADVKTVLKDKGIAHIGVGVAKGENRILEAVRLAVNSPLLETTIEGAKAVILYIAGAQDLSLEEVNNAASLVHDVVDSSANIIYGHREDPNVHDEVEITVIATGFPQDNPAVSPAPQAQNTQKPAAQPARPQEPYYRQQPTYVRTNTAQSPAAATYGYGQPAYGQPAYGQQRPAQPQQAQQYQQPAQQQYQPQQAQQYQQPSQQQYQPQQAQQYQQPAQQQYQPQQAQQYQQPSQQQYQPQQAQQYQQPSQQQYQPQQAQQYQQPVQQQYDAPDDTIQRDEKKVPKFAQIIRDWGRKRDE